MTEWTEISKKQYEEFGKIPKAPALKDLEKRIKALDEELELLEKNFKIERETHQADMKSKDIEIGRLMTKINLK